MGSGLLAAGLFVLVISSVAGFRGGGEGEVFDGSDGLLISLGSVLLSGLAMVPGTLVDASNQDAASPVWGQAFLAGVLMRTIGTVALFLGSSYYMGAPIVWSAVWVLAWHVGLLAVEVVLVTRNLNSRSSSI